MPMETCLKNPIAFKVYRIEVVEMGKAALLVVKNFNVIENARFRFLKDIVKISVNQLCAYGETVRHSVIPAIAFSPHTTLDGMSLSYSLKLIRDKNFLSNLYFSLLQAKFTTYIHLIDFSLLNDFHI